MSGLDSLEQLAAEARYRRQRLDLYRAKTYSGRPTSEAHLRELRRASESADARLKKASDASTHDSETQTRTGVRT